MVDDPPGDPSGASTGPHLDLAHSACVALGIGLLWQPVGPLLGGFVLAADALALAATAVHRQDGGASPRPITLPEPVDELGRRANVVGERMMSAGHAAGRSLRPELANAAAAQLRFAEALRGTDLDVVLGPEAIPAVRSWLQSGSFGGFLEANEIAPAWREAARQQLLAEVERMPVGARAADALAARARSLLWHADNLPGP